MQVISQMYLYQVKDINLVSHLVAKLGVVKNSVSIKRSSQQSKGKLCTRYSTRNINCKIAVSLNSAPIKNTAQVVGVLLIGAQCSRCVRPLGSMLNSGPNLLQTASTGSFKTAAHNYAKPRFTLTAS